MKKKGLAGFFLAGARALDASSKRIVRAVLFFIFSSSLLPSLHFPSEGASRLHSRRAARSIAAILRRAGRNARRKLVGIQIGARPNLAGGQFGPHGSLCGLVLCREKRSRSWGFKNRTASPLQELWVKSRCATVSTNFAKAVPSPILFCRAQKSFIDFPRGRDAMLKIKRIYESPEKEDGFRVLVDRLWPRGISKERAHLDLWLRDVAPSDALRKWFGHDPNRWSAFVAKYRKESAAKKDLLRQIKKLEAENGTVTLLYAAHDPQHNQAVALQQFLKGARAK
jgi:uncharacterized protein YeaO (DUF488 family)